MKRIGKEYSPNRVVDRILLLNRHLAKQLSRLLLHTPVTPNQVTLGAMGCGFIAAAFLSRGSQSSVLMAAFFLQLSFILDNCDGEIARAKKLSSQFGMWLDYVADLLVDYAIWIGLALGSYAYAKAAWIFWVAAAACVGSTLNFWRVIKHRKQTTKQKRQEALASHPLLRALQILGDDGDPSLLFWMLALVAAPDFILVCGTFYIFTLWIVGSLHSQGAE